MIRGAQETSADAAGLAAGVVAALTWGATGIWVRLLPGFSALEITAGRLMIAFAVLGTWLLISGETDATRAAMREPVTWWLGFMLIAYYVLAVIAFQLAPVAEVSLCISTSPLFVLIWHGLRGRAPGRRDTTGAVMALTGVYLVMAPWTESTGVTSLRLEGDALALLSALAAAAYAQVYRKAGVAGGGPASTSVALATFGPGMLLLIALSALMEGAVALPALSPHSVAIFLLLGVVSTVVPTLGYAICSRRLPPLTTTMVRLLSPVFAAIFAGLVLGELPSIWALPGGCLILAGVMLIVIAGKSREQERREAGS